MAAAYPEDNKDPEFKKMDPALKTHYLRCEKSITDDIRYYYVSENVYKNVSRHFEDTIIKVWFDEVPVNRLVEELCRLIRNDESIDPAKQADLLLFADNTDPIEFLSRTFIFAMLQENHTKETGGKAPRAEDTLAKIETIVSQATKERVAQGNYADAYDLQNLIDRKDLLRLIDVKLAETSLPVYLHAVGGLGKSEVALAFCNSDYASSYSYIFWVTASSGDIRSDIMQRQEFNFRRDQDCGIDEDFIRFTALSKELKGRILLVIDNVESLEQIRQIEKRDSVAKLRWNVLVTTRAIKDDLNFRNRVLLLEELEAEYCEELFYRHYEADEETISANQKTLRGLFVLLNHHTLLIKLMAKIGERAGYTIEQLNGFVREHGLFHQRLQIPVDIDGSEDRDKMDDVIASLFEVSHLSEDEKRILSCMSILPNRAIPENVLHNWLDRENEDNIAKSVIHALFENGWLMRQKDAKTKESAFWCHKIIQSAIKARIPHASEDIKALICNLTNFFEYKRDGRDYLPLRPYLDCIESVIENYPNDSKEMFSLILHYVKWLNLLSEHAKRAAELAQWLYENYEHIFTSDTETTGWKRGKLDVCNVYAVSITEYSERKGKYQFVYGVRQANFEFAQSFLPETDYLYIDTYRFLAASMKSNNMIAQSCHVLSKLKEQISRIIEQPEFQQDAEWRQLFLLTLGSLGLSYSRLFDQETDVIKRREALGVALEARATRLRIALDFYPKNSYRLRIPHNDLGMTYLYLFDLDAEQGSLEHAEEHLLKSYEIRVNCVGENSLSVALALANLSRFLFRKKEYEKSLELAYKSLALREKLGSTKKSRTMMLLHRHIANVYLQMHKSMKEESLLHKGAASIERAVDLCDFLYGDNTSQSEYVETMVIRDEYEHLGVL
jgi:hypothetical protein